MYNLQSNNTLNKFVSFSFKAGKAHKTRFTQTNL